MNKELKAITALLITAMFMAMVTPVTVTDESSALTDDNVLSLNSKDCLIYCNSTTDNSFVFTVSNIPDGYTASNITWSFNNIGDGIGIASFSPDSSVSTVSGTATVTVYAEAEGSVEVLAKINGTELVASAVAVVFQNAGVTATEFHYFIQFDSTLPDSYLSQMTDLSTSEINKIIAGAWYTVSSTEVVGAFNAWTAFEKLCSREGWELNGSSNGWINTFHNLSTYPGEDGSYIYWAQYHRVSNSDSSGYSWAFNNTTMSYMTSVDQSYIGLFFWASPSSGDVPTYPGF